MRGFLIGTAIGLISVAIVLGVGFIAQYFCDRGEATQFLVVMITAMVLISGIYRAKIL